MKSAYPSPRNGSVIKPLPFRSDYSWRRAGKESIAPCDESLHNCTLEIFFRSFVRQVGCQAMFRQTGIDAEPTDIPLRYRSSSVMDRVEPAHAVGCSVARDRARGRRACVSCG